MRATDLGHASQAALQVSDLLLFFFHGSLALLLRLGDSALQNLRIDSPRFQYQKKSYRSAQDLDSNEDSNPEGPGSEAGAPYGSKAWQDTRRLDEGGGESAWGKVQQRDQGGAAPRLLTAS